MTEVVSPRGAPFPWQQLPTVSRAEQIALRRFSPKRPRVDVAALEDATGSTLSLVTTRPLTYAVSDAFPHLVATSTLVELSAHESTIFVEAEPQFALRALARAFGFEDSLPLALLSGLLRSTDTALEQGALAYLGALGARGSGYRVVAVHQNAPISSVQHPGFFCETFRVAAVFDDARFEGDVRVWHPDTLNSMARLPYTKLADDIELCFQLERGASLCPIATLRSLMVGDLVMLDIDTRFPDTGRTLRSRPSGLAIHLDDTDRILGLVIGPPQPQSAQPRKPSMNDSTSHSQETSVATLRELDLESLSVTLSFELAEIALTVGELRSMRVGQVLSTGKLLGERVLIKASGRPIGHGELVNLDGEVGVRVLDLKPSYEAM